MNTVDKVIKTYVSKIAAEWQLLSPCYYVYFESIESV